MNPFFQLYFSTSRGKQTHLSFDIRQCPHLPYGVYLPPNISLIQPLDQGVINIFKTLYIWYSMEKTVNPMEENPNRENIMKV